MGHDHAPAVLGVPIEVGSDHRRLGRLIRYPDVLVHYMHGQALVVQA